LLRLRWEDVDLISRELRLRSTITKTARSRTVGLSDRALEELTELWESSPGKTEMSVFAIGEFKKSFKTACIEAGVTGFRFHDCRHTCISRWIQQGLAVGEAMKLAGHQTLSMHARYTNIDQETARRGAKAMNQYHEEAPEPPVN
jgi:integrase